MPGKITVPGGDASTLGGAIFPASASTNFAAVYLMGRSLTASRANRGSLTLPQPSAALAVNSGQTLVAPTVNSGDRFATLSGTGHFDTGLTAGSALTLLIALKSTGSQATGNTRFNAFGHLDTGAAAGQKGISLYTASATVLRAQCGYADATDPTVSLTIPEITTWRAYCLQISATGMTLEGLTAGTSDSTSKASAIVPTARTLRIGGASVSSAVGIVDIGGLMWWDRLLTSDELTAEKAQFRSLMTTWLSVSV